MILIADDNEIYLDYLTELFDERTNLEIKSTGDCRELLDEIAFLNSVNKCPQIVIIDLIMIPITGKECVEKIRESYEHPVPIIAMSGDVTEQQLIDLYKSGVNAYMPKSHIKSNLVPYIDGIVNLYLQRHQINIVKNRRATDARNFNKFNTGGQA